MTEKFFSENPPSSDKNPFFEKLTTPNNKATESNFKKNDCSPEDPDCKPDEGCSPDDCRPEGCTPIEDCKPDDSINNDQSRGSTFKP